jgi:hypothetical protein
VRSGTSESGHGTKSLRDSALRQAASTAKLNRAIHLFALAVDRRQCGPWPNIQQECIGTALTLIDQRRCSRRGDDRCATAERIETIFIGQR